MIERYSLVFGVHAICLREVRAFLNCFESVKVQVYFQCLTIYIMMESFISKMMCSMSVIFPFCFSQYF